MKISYEEYDKIEESCGTIMEASRGNVADGPARFEYLSSWPTVGELEAADAEKNFKKFFRYLMFWYTQDLTEELKEDPKALKEYQEAMKYIRELFKRKIEFEEDEG